MDLTLPPLPCPIDALEPQVPVATLVFHDGRHHAGYAFGLERPHGAFS